MPPSSEGEGLEGLLKILLVKAHTAHLVHGHLEVRLDGVHVHLQLQASLDQVGREHVDEPRKEPTLGDDFVVVAVDGGAGVVGVLRSRTPGLLALVAQHAPRKRLLPVSVVWKQTHFEVSALNKAKKQEKQ